MSQLKSLYHSTAHECTCYRSCYTNNTIQYTDKSVAAERSPRAASTSNVEKIEVHHICPSARQHVEKELRSRSFAVGLRGECRKNRVTSALPRGNTCKMYFLKKLIFFQNVNLLFKVDLFKTTGWHSCALGAAGHSSLFAHVYPECPSPRRTKSVHRHASKR